MARVKMLYTGASCLDYNVSQEGIKVLGVYLGSED